MQEPFMGKVKVSSIDRCPKSRCAPQEQFKCEKSHYTRSSENPMEAHQYYLCLVLVLVLQFLSQELHHSQRVQYLTSAVPTIHQTLTEWGHGAGGEKGANLEMKVLRLSLGGAALTPPGAVMSSTNRLSCSVLRSSLLHTHTHTHTRHTSIQA